MLSKLREAFRLSLRGYRILSTIDPKCFPIQSALAIVEAATPLFAVFMSARIIDALESLASQDRLLVLVVSTVIVSLCLGLLRVFLTKHLYVFNRTLQQKYLLYLRQHFRLLEYKHQESSSVAASLANIEAMTNIHSSGIMMLYWSYRGLARSAFSSILALSLVMTSSSSIREPSYSVSSVVTSATIVALFACSQVISIILYRRQGVEAKMVLTENQKMNGVLQYYLRYIKPGAAGKEIRIYDQQPLLKKTLDDGLNTKKWHELYHNSGLLSGIGLFADTVCSGLVTLIICLRALSGAFSIGGVVQFVGAFSALSASTTQLLSSIVHLFNNSEFLPEVFAYLDLAKSNATIEAGQKMVFDAMGVEIEFRNVTFSYPGAKEAALQNVTLRLEAGQSLAIVGENGSGKTTLIKLLCRFYEPDAGCITLNGVDIRQIDLQDYYRALAVVFQDYQLFGLSVGQNVSAAENFDQHSVHSSLSAVGLSERVNAMPFGLDAIILKDLDKNGVNISGGEAQKIALARALYKSTPLIVLDEPTAALDPISEHEVYTHMHEMTQEKTTIFVSHRLSSCRFCDRIAVFDAGVLVQYGKHEELLEDAKGKYYQLWRAQAVHYA